MRRLTRRLPPSATLFPLLGAYLLLAALYAWQAWRRETPTLFSDEIEFTQVSRSIAETGRAVARGANTSLPGSLYEHLAAPAWWLDSVGAAYTAIKTLGVLLMTATVFPAYALARLIVAPPYALFAAVATVAAPALSYSPFLVDEPLAYPLSTLALLLIGRAGLRPTRTSVAVAVLACGLAVLARTQLAVLFPVLALVLLVVGWRSRPMRSWRATWTRGDVLGAAVLGLGIVLALSAFLGHRSFTWYLATGFYKERMLEYGLWAMGALAIGIGVLPMVAALVSLASSRRGAPDPRADLFTALTLSAVFAFGLYTALKAAYLSTNFAVVIAERNLIYLTPLLFAGTALVFERRRPGALITVAATGFVVYLVTTTPYSVDRYPNYETHGLAIAAFANRILRWPPETIETALVLIALCSGGVIAALGLTRAPWLGRSMVMSLMCLVLAWNLTTEIYAARGEERASDQQYAVLPKPPDWVEHTTGRQPTLFIGQGVSDINPFYQLEFWNPSIRWFWGIDGSTPDGVNPNLSAPDGTQDPEDLGAEYVVASRGVQLAAPKVTQVGGYDVYRVGGDPVRLSEATTGIAADGWMGEHASYTRYEVDPDVGSVMVTFSRQGACFPQLEPTRVSIRVGPVAVGPDDQPTIERTTSEATGELPACGIEPLVVPVPSGSWRVEARVADTFVPNELDANQGDRRELGAVVSFERLSRYGG